MKTIKENILDNTNSGKLGLTKKLLKKLNNRMWSGSSGEDNLGHKLEIGDIVLDKDTFSFWWISLIQDSNVILENAEGNKEKVTVCNNLIKIIDPEKYVK